MYVDGFLIVVPENRKAAYIEQAKFAAAIFKEHGATRVVEAWQDDVPDGKLTSFPMAVKRQDGEAVCFSWIEYPDKATRDRCQKASMEDPRFAEMSMSDMVFDGPRLVMGGFESLLDDHA